MLAPTDTIAAIATAPGRGGIGVIRISGPAAGEICKRVIGRLPSPRRAALAEFRDEQGEILDTGLILYFAAPASFTGEDVVELHGHGSPVALDLLLGRVLALGARLAEPGEFSRRAFLNDKLDLTQAEAIADLIASDSAQAARAALRSMQGEFGKRLHALAEAITETRLHVEAVIDFPDEEVDLLDDAVLLVRLSKAQALAADIESIAQQGALLRDGMHIVIAGKPNAGKSSLLNALAGYEAAIVTPVPGTTRDVLRERIHIDGMPLHIVDTAGLRDSADVVEAEGIRRAHEEIRKANRVLYVNDVNTTSQPELDAEFAGLPQDMPITLVCNKIDLAGMEPHIEASKAPRIFLSAVTGAGIELLRSHLKESMGYHGADAGTFSARRRHLDALQRTVQHLRQAECNLLERRAGELGAEELRLAQRAIGEITGEVTSDDLLGRIFATFCIGK